MQRVWLSHATEPRSVCTGKAGWLRLRDRPPEGTTLLVATDLPPLGDVPWVDGEWTDGATSWRRFEGQDETIVLTEHAKATNGAAEVLKTLRSTKLRVTPEGDTKAGWGEYAIYFGFRSEADRHEGRLDIIAERFAGFSHG